MRTRNLTVGGAVAAAQLALAGLVDRFGVTTLLPMHFNAAGEVDRWGGRSEAAAIIVVLVAVVAVSSLGFALTPDQRPDRGEPRSYAVAHTLILLATSLVAGLISATAFGYVPAGRQGVWVHMAVLWLILGTVGAVLGKVTPNALVGVRTPWTRASRLSWDKSNRLAGRLFLWGGLVGVIAAPFTPEPLGMRLSLSVVLIIAGLAVLESWRVWKRDPERLAGL